MCLLFCSLVNVTAPIYLLGVSYAGGRSFLPRVVRSHSRQSPRPTSGLGGITLLLPWFPPDVPLDLCSAPRRHKTERDIHPYQSNLTTSARSVEVLGGAVAADTWETYIRFGSREPPNRPVP